MKVFLGGTCSDSTWRKYAIEQLTIDYFNPIVDEWNDEAQKIEEEEKASSDYHLYFLTPLYEGYFSIAEIIDESFHHPEKVIFSFIEEDGGKRFTEDEINTLKSLGERVRENRGRYLESLEDVCSFLNTPVNKEYSSQFDAERFDFFISYGREYSKPLSRKLYEDLSNQGYKVWYDKEDLEVGLDFQQKINVGIRKSDNFLFIISPSSVESQYCLKEIIVALENGKKIIPLEEVNRKSEKHLKKDEEKGVDNTNWDITDSMLPVIEDTHWLDFKKWDKGSVYEDSLNDLIDRQKKESFITSRHTNLLLEAHEWRESNEDVFYLLPHNRYIQAQEWLEEKRTFDGCNPCELHSDFILESKLFYEGGLSDVCLIEFDHQETEESRKNSTKGLTELLVENGMSFESVSVKETAGKVSKAMTSIIMKSVDVVFVIDDALLEHNLIKPLIEEANLYKKRIHFVALSRITKEVPSDYDFVDLSGKSRISQKDLSKRSDFVIGANEFLRSFLTDKDYYNIHNYILNKAIQWETYDKRKSLLLFDQDLVNATIWINKSIGKKDVVLDVQKELIAESEKAKIGLIQDVLIINDSSESVLTKIIGRDLRLQGKIVSYNLDDNSELAIDSLAEKASSIVLILNNSEESKELYRIVSGLNKKKIICHRNNIDLEIETSGIVVQPVSSDKTIGGSEILQFLNVDNAYDAKHTILSGKVKAWLPKRNQKDEADFLLRNEEYLLAKAWYEEAIKEGKSPAPTEDQSDYIQESFAALERIRKREKRIDILMKAGGLIMMILIGFIGYYAYETNELKIEAERKSDENLKLKDSAILQRDENIKLKNSAIAKSEENDSLYRLTVIQKKIAEDQRDENLRLKEKAEFQSIENLRLKDSAIVQRDENVRLFKEAELNEVKTFKRLMISESNRLSNVALQMPNQKKDDRKKRKKLAVASYLLNRNYNGMELLNGCYNVFLDEYPSPITTSFKSNTAIAKVVQNYEYVTVGEISGKVSVLRKGAALVDLKLDLKMLNEIKDVVWIKQSDAFLVCDGSLDGLLFSVKKGRLASMKELQFQEPIHGLKTDDKGRVVLVGNRKIYLANLNTLESATVIHESDANISYLDFEDDQLVWSTKGKVNEAKYAKLQEFKLGEVQSILMNGRITCIEVKGKEGFFVGTNNGSVFYHSTSKEMDPVDIIHHDKLVTDLRYQNNRLFSTGKDKALRVSKIEDITKYASGNSILVDIGAWGRTISLFEDSEYLIVGGDEKRIEFIPVSSDVVYEKNKKGDFSKCDLDLLQRNSTVEQIKLPKE